MYEQESVYIINEIIKVCLIVYVQNEVHFNTIIWEKNLSLIFFPTDQRYQVSCLFLLL